MDAPDLSNLEFEHWPRLEGLSDDEVAEILIPDMERIKDRDKVAIVSGSGSKTVNEIISAIRSRNPEGVEFIRLFRAADKRLRDPERPRAKVGLLSRLGGHFQDAVDSVLDRFTNK